MLLVVFILNVFAVRAALTSGNKHGGQVCDFTLYYNKVSDHEVPTNVPSFTAYASLNATGFYDTEFEYDPEFDTCPGPTAFAEQGISQFSFTYNDFEYSLADDDFFDESPWIYHYPIGLPSSEIAMSKILDNYFEFFVFEASGNGLDFFPCCVDEGTCFCACVTDDTIHCITKIERTDCYDNNIPFDPTIFVTLSPPDALSSYSTDPNFDYEWFFISPLENSSSEFVSPVIVAEGSMVVYRDDHGSLIDLSNDLCAEGTPCWFFRNTPNWNGGQLNLALTMWHYVGQAMRLQLVMSYRSLPNNDGQVCIYFDYAGVNTDPLDAIDQTVFNRIWCGTLQPYNAQLSTLSVEMPLTYGPAYEFENDGEYDGEGYDTFRPIIIKGNSQSSFVVYDVTIQAMGQTYPYSCSERRKKRQENSTAPAPFGSLDEAYSVWRTYNRIPKKNLTAYVTQSK